MSFCIENRTYGYADINLFDGSRVCLNKGEAFHLKHTPTESEKRYYSKLNCLGIYLVEYSDSSSVEEFSEPSVEEFSEPSVEEFSEPSVEEFSEPSVEEFSEPSVEEKVDYTKVSFNDLMKLRQAELIDIAHNLGHSDVNTDFSKKEIVRLIRGE